MSHLASPRRLARSLASPGLAVVAAVALGAGCGDRLMTAQDRGDVVFSVHGRALLVEGDQLSKSLSGGLRLDPSLPPGEQYEAAVLFLLARDYADPQRLGPSRLEIEVVKGAIEGEFPADFRVELTDPPTTYPYNATLLHQNLDGSLNEGMFAAAGRTPDRVRIGHLAIGPAAELDALPARIMVDLGTTRTLGQPLAQYLPTTTITPYQVLYAEGVEAHDVIYPKRTLIGQEEGGLPITAGFTLIDARQYFAGTMWQECGRMVLHNALQSPAYTQCRYDNKSLIDCLEGCSFSATPDLPTCRNRCYTGYADMIDERGCLRQAGLPSIEEICGPEVTPDPLQQKILQPSDSLTVKLDVDDVKSGMWVLHLFSDDSDS